MDDVTSKGIWSAGIVALGALAAFCIWHHAPVSAPLIQALPNAATTTAAATPVMKGALPPVVTGPKSDATVNMPSGKSIPVAPKLEAPAVVAKVEPKIEVPVVEAPKVEAPKVEAPKVEAPKIETPIAEAPKVEAKPVVVTPKPVAMKAKKKRVMVAKRFSNGCEFKRDASVVRSICFNFNSDRLSATSKAKLNAIIPTLKDGKQVELNGFADAVGKKAYNSNLSERRNNAVLKYLESKGIDAAKVSVKSFGSEEAEKQKMGKNQRERRVDIRLSP